MAFQPLRITLPILSRKAPRGEICKPSDPLCIYPVMPDEQIRKKTQEAMTRVGETLERIEQTGTTFFLTDLDLAITMTRIASDAPKASEKRARNRANARHAYDAISRISHHAVLPEKERRDVDNKLAELRSALEQLREEFT
jgi:hypothetical protein